MTNFIQFSDGVFVEVEQVKPQQQDGVIKAGLGDNVRNSFVKAQDSFKKALEGTVQSNVQAFIDAVQSLPNTPSEVELSFGIKVIGETGNLAIGKIGGETNYSIKVVWKSLDKNK